MKVLFRYWIFIPLILLGLIPFVWFWDRGGALINGVDTNFPLDPPMWFSRRFFVWNNIINAGSDFSSSTAGLFFHLIQVVPYTLGFNLQIAQIISLLFWFLVIVIGAYILAKLLFPRHKLIQLVFVVLYSFNPYLFNTWENVKVTNLSLVAAIPFALALLILLNNAKLSYARAFLCAVLIGVVVSGTGINPSYFLSFFLTLLIFVLAGIIMSLKNGELLRILKNFLFFSTVVVLTNFFWILPTINFVFKTIAPSGSIDKIGFTNWIDSLSQNTSLLNVMRVQGAWDWYAIDSVTGLPFYIPYALNYFNNFPFLAFSFLLPALAIAALFFRDTRKLVYYITFAIMLIVGVFLGVGTHLPTGSAFRWLSNHLPFFTLFRSPWYIFTPMVTLALAGLVGLLLSTFARRTESRNLRLQSFFVHAACIVLIIGNLFYSYPLVTGKIFRPTRPDSFFITFPSYVYDTQTWLAQNEDCGRIMGYPDDEIEKFMWGYIGIESILGLLVDCEAIFSPINTPDAPVAQMIKQLYNNIKKHQLAVADKLAAKLNVRLLFEKQDQETLSAQLPSPIKSIAFKNFGPWNFYQFPQEYLPKIYATNKVFFGYPYKLGHQLIGVLEGKDALVNPEDSVVARTPGLTALAGHVVLARNSQIQEFKEFSDAPSQLGNRLLSRNLSNVTFTFDVPADGVYQPIIERYRLEDFGIDFHKGLQVELDDKSVLLRRVSESDSYLYLEPIEFTQGSHIISLRLENKNLIARGSDIDEITVFEKFGKGTFEIVETNGNKYLSILNRGEGAPEPSANFEVFSFDPMVPYFFRVSYKQIYGNNASAVVLQGNDYTLFKAQTERLPNYPEWNTFSFYFEPVKSPTIAKIALVAPFVADPLGTKVLYDDLAVYKVFTNNLLFVRESNVEILASPTIQFTKRSPVSYEAQVSGSNGPHLIVFSENYSPEWELIVKDHNGSVLTIAAAHFSTNMYANVWYLPITPQNYTLKIYYKPQKLFKVGLLLSGVSILVGVFLFLRNRRIVVRQ